jgi:hypothetical protein
MLPGRGAQARGGPYDVCRHKEFEAGRASTHKQEIFEPADFYFASRLWLRVPEDG